MTGRLKTKYAPAFSLDLKKAAKRNWSLTDLEAVIGLVLDNTVESMNILRQLNGTAHREYRYAV